MIATTDHDGGIRELRLDRPPVNALSPDLVVALREAVLRAPEEGARALVLSGSNGRFSGGLDVVNLLAMDRAGIGRLWRDFYQLLLALAGSKIPIVAAMETQSTLRAVVDRLKRK
jgi:3,2-trans-enoyl-CoA isomerase